MFDSFLNRGISEELIQKRIIERIDSGDSLSRKSVKLSLLIHIVYCSFIVIGGIIAYLSIADSSTKWFVASFFLALFGAQLSSIVEIRDRWRYGQVCINLFRDKSLDKK